jgi:hypothetical protein
MRLSTDAGSFAAGLALAMPKPARRDSLGYAISRRPGERWARFAERIANEFGLVLILVAAYVLASVAPYADWRPPLIAAVTSLSAVVALATAAARPPITWWAACLGAAAVVLAALSAPIDVRFFRGLSGLILVVLLSAAASLLLRSVIREREVGFRTILGAVSVYFMLGLLFTFLYYGIDQLQSEPFFGGTARANPDDFLFFSLTTLTTTGYGDLVPAGQPGKMLAGLEMLTGQLFVVTLIAALVTLWRPARPGSRGDSEQPPPEAKGRS